VVALLDLLMPPACAACGRSGALLCPSCLSELRRPSGSADRFLAPDASVVVGESLSLALAAFAHDGAARRGLAALKYAAASRMAPILARAAEPALRELMAISGPAILVPVPVHIERRRARGYNQAELLARELARLVELRFSDLLVRARPTTKQHRLNRAARLQNLRGAFVMRPGASAPRTAILVDDIVTTTATLEACASVLRAAGCQVVYGFAVAREV
jgi:ComF family protein